MSLKLGQSLMGTGVSEQNEEIIQTAFFSHVFILPFLSFSWMADSYHCR